MNRAVRTILVLGGARSGKSAHAQRLAEAAAEAAGGDLVFIATAEAYDDEMRDRIARHRADRDARWRTVEAPRDLAEAIRAEGGEGRTILVDCLTLWLSNLLLADADLDAAGEALAAAAEEARARIVLVSNEVGFGIVPDNALARRFRDAAGRLNQRMAARCEAVDLVVAGIPLPVKPR
ncbi:bifunctional adenosylcobinamide kinase/adenosylcobinamide-phosphate guanylyltransferase [Sphingomonas sp. AP4-R1]|uniref:bifunctional adenosylcobinamide kinase/adenosylcobinamide-phosphate guanylyltransferase n=1 Tax=Sphingomonas sp. AP4-R1 TaxID=2735134 RepID=UPI0014935FA9|nr:bifunctional adenosylcobinamide kinase/adenosylcobinamide-phosphate guanylyltransferase [Sphingomonas sp. AP4-R1]QJU59755.1 bifunctional adenosylcobinamide kinase/adenosylcobinamide-phosphate guanylyltransferase [Sphingomonas sp. AP4-R1]